MTVREALNELVTARRHPLATRLVVYAICFGWLFVVAHFHNRNAAKYAVVKVQIEGAGEWTLPQPDENQPPDDSEVDTSLRRLERI